MRSALDKLISWTGLALAVVLLVAGGLLTWAHGFIGDEVHDQLAMQHITMPAKDALETEAQHAALDRYAGQDLTTGAQAKAYADHYIQAHLDAMSGGRTYSEVSGEYLAMQADTSADPKALATLGELRQTMFMGDTLRGLLLYGYAFATMGTIAGIAAVVSFLGAGVMLVLSGLGLWHSRRVTVRSASGAGAGALATT